ncbi:MAG: hypothetical protein HY553_16720 [Elusimicrobia bacterium]|nr:hypothetical protein [Elusimicrobiota bacterium]
MTTMTTTETLTADAALAELQRVGRKARALLADLPADTDPAALRAEAAVYAAQQPAFGVGVTPCASLWRRLARIEGHADAVDAALGEAARVLAEAERVAGQPLPPAEAPATSLTDIHEREARERDRRGAETILAALPAPLDAARRLRGVLVETAGRLAVAALAVSEAQHADVLRALQARQREALRTLREQTHAADAEHRAAVARWAARVGRALDAPGAAESDGP